MGHVGMILCIYMKYCSSGGVPLEDILMVVDDIYVCSIISPVVNTRPHGTGSVFAKQVAKVSFGISMIRHDTGQKSPDMRKGDSMFTRVSRRLG